MRSPLVAFLLLLALPGAQAAAQPAPQLAVGDFWEYAGSAKAGDAGEEAALSLRVDVVAIAAGQVEIRSFTTSQADSGNLTRTQTTSWHRAEDLALIRSASFTRSARGALTSTANLTTQFTQPCVERVYPFDAESTWDVVCEGRTEGIVDLRKVNVSADRNETVRVAAAATATFPAGAAEAYLLTTTTSTGSTIQAHFAPGICRDVDTRTSHKGVMSELELTAWSCAATGTRGGAPTIVVPTDLAVDRIKVPTQEAPVPGGFVFLLAVALVAAAYARPKVS